MVPCAAVVAVVVAASVVVAHSRTAYSAVVQPMFAASVACVAFVEIGYVGCSVLGLGQMAFAGTGTICAAIGADIADWLGIGGTCGLRSGIAVLVTVVGAVGLVNAVGD
jgi:hypothetical protein